MSTRRTSVNRQRLIARLDKKVQETKVQQRLVREAATAHTTPAMAPLAPPALTSWPWWQRGWPWWPWLLLLAAAAGLLVLRWT